MAADISAQIAVDGEKQFKDSIKAIDSELKALGSEMKEAVSAFDNMAEAEKDYSQQAKVLNDTIDKQKEKLDVLQGQFSRSESELQRLADELERAKREFGENSEQAGKAQNAYNRQATEVNKLRGQIAETNTKINTASKELQNLGKSSTEAEKHVKTFGDTFKGVLSANVVTAGFNAIANGMKSAVNAFKDGISAVGSYGDSIDKGSQKMRISAEDYQKLAFAAERSGTSIDVLATAQKSLASSGFSGSIMEALDYVASFSDESERAAAATELFGKKAGQDLLPLLNSGKDGLQAMYEEVEALGGVMSNEAVASAAAFEDAMTNLKTAFDGVKNQSLGEFLPAITDVFTGIVEIIKGNTEEGKMLIEKGFNDIGDKISQFTKNLAEHAPEMLEMGIKLLTALIKGILSALPVLAAQTPEIIGVLVRGIQELFAEITNVGWELMDTLSRSLSDKLMDIKNIGRNVVAGLWEGIKERSSWLLDMVRGWCQSILDEIKGFFHIESPSKVMRNEVGTMLGRGMALGIDDSAKYAVASMQELGASVLDASPQITSVGEMQANATSGIVNGLAAIGNSNPVNLSVQLVLQNGQLIAEQIFDDILSVGKQRGVALG